MTSETRTEVVGRQHRGRESTARIFHYTSPTHAENGMNNMRDRTALEMTKPDLIQLCTWEKKRRLLLLENFSWSKSREPLLNNHQQAKKSTPLNRREKGTVPNSRFQ